MGREIINYSNLSHHQRFKAPQRDKHNQHNESIIYQGIQRHKTYSHALMLYLSIKMVYGECTAKSSTATCGTGFQKELVYGGCTIGVPN